MHKVSLVLGGTRSGKSAFAESLVLAARGTAPATYLATAEPWDDDEMRGRIAAHRDRRGADWRTVEEPLDLPGALRAVPAGSPVLVDCLTLWLSNLMAAERDPAAETDRLIAALADVAGPVVFVSNEVGWGIVPDNALARAFRDEAGRLHQAVAAAADAVYLVVAGLPLPLKPRQVP